MQQTVEVIYESRGFRLINPANLQLFEGQKVRLIIEPPAQSPTSPLDLAAQVSNLYSHHMEKYCKSLKLMLSFDSET